MTRAEIPVLLEKLDEGNDLVIGSRYIQGGRCDYAWYRRWLSQTANVAICQLLRSQAFGIYHLLSGIPS